MKVWNPALYNDKHSFVYEYGANLISLLDPKEGERILDVGCGSGQLTAQIARSGALVTGIDSSPQMIEDAKLKFAGIEFYVKDAADFAFDEPFDAIFSNAALHWVLDAEGAVDCMFHALKKGGRLVAEMGGKDNVASIINQVRKSLDEHGFKEHARRQVWYFPSPAEYASLLERHGFTVSLLQYYDRPTELADSEHGVEDWLEMFGATFFEGLKKKEIDSIKKEVQEKIKSKIFRQGKWYADYKRLRFVAKKF